MNRAESTSFFKNNWIHFLAIAVFFLTSFLYFKPQFSGYSLKQQDVVQFKGASNEINHFREVAGEEPLWTNSMFGGMPTYQISTQFKGNLLHQIYRFFRIYIGSPAGLFLLYLIGFYIALLCMKIDPKLALIGAFAFAFSSYNIIILEAGHNTKAAAIALAPPVFGAFYMAYRSNFKWGVLLSAVFMGLQLSVSHPQITYYLGILLFFVGIAELIRYIKQKELLSFVKVSGGLIAAYAFAFVLNYGLISLTQDYAKHTIRGGNDITIDVDGSTNHHNTTSGLDKDYITQWSYGVKETMTLISPNVYGGGSAALANSQFSDLLRSQDLRKDASLVANNNIYWGDQPFTSGPVYMGIIVFFLALLGLVYLKGKYKWFLFAATLLMIMLSWGKNFMGLTDFFIENVPFYNKFRAVTIILSIVEFTIPLLGMLFLHYLFQNKEEIKGNLKPFYITSGVALLSIGILTFTGLGNGYLSEQESDFLYSYKDQIRAQLAKEDPQVLLQNGIDINNPQIVQQVVDQQYKSVSKQFDALVVVRKAIYQSSMKRSLFFLVVAIALITLYVKTTTRKEYVMLGLGVFIIVDLVMIDVNYLNAKKTNGRTYDYWIEKEKQDFPQLPTEADKQILEMELASNSELESELNLLSNNKENRRQKGESRELWSKKFQILNGATNYRVYEPAIGFNSSRASYFHKALNGYHGAKLRRIQNVKDFHINYNNMAVFNMLNVKYFIQNDRAMLNPDALGPVWLVQELTAVSTPDEEILSLGNSYEIKNQSDLSLIVNEEKKTEAIIYGREKVFLVDQSDSIPVDINRMALYKVNTSYVEDVNGSREWIPTYELAKDSLNSFRTLVTVEVLKEFNPEREAIILEKEAANLSSLVFDGEGTIEMISYAPNRLVYNVDVANAQFAVFSEMYYPDGWNAYINGEKVDIYRVDYLLRGVELPQGQYALEMRFEVPKYKLSNRISLAGSSLLIILIIGLFVKDFILNKESKDAA